MHTLIRDSQSQTFCIKHFFSFEPGGILHFVQQFEKCPVGAIYITLTSAARWLPKHKDQRKSETASLALFKNASEVH